MTLLDNENYWEEVKSTKKCVVDFFATWCGPCKSMNPILESISINSDTKNVFKINIEENRDLIEKLNITSVPTFIFYENGKEKERKTGVLSKGYIMDALR